MSSPAEKLRLEYVPLATCLLFAQNVKLHDLGSIIDSIKRHGFKDPPKWEPTLNGGKGGIVAGNGRIQALTWMKGQGDPVPRGILLEQESDDWAVPVIFGVDAASEHAAWAYSIDHNSLVMAGGDVTQLDISRVYDANYAQFLETLNTADQLPVTVDTDDLALFRRLAEQDQAPEAFQEYGDELETDYRCPSCGYEWSGQPR